ncbi:MAG: tetratricopeptide repeat protein [Planctomycetes bacterium]|nr:tetratricopeptide repeat protein [Planctomycetota bacterium]
MTWLAPLASIESLGILAQLSPYRGNPVFDELVGGGMSLLWLVYTGFWFWMLVHCLRSEPDRFFWLWVMIIVPGVGPIVYFVVRYLPASDHQVPGFLRRWTRGRELSRLETAAVQIGNPHQFILWGDALRDVGQLDQAASAYDRALAKEPQNLPALWGAAQVAALQKRPADVRRWTRQILDKDPKYKFGDVSLAYGKSVLQLGDVSAATEHFEQHIQNWRNPEAVYLLATLYADQGKTQGARKHLQALMHDINGSPAAIARRSGRWKSRARQLLRKLPE